jgi:phosphatidylserine synthase
MSSNKQISYGTIRRDYQTHYSVEPILADYYAKAISPAFTRYFVGAGVSPNAVTVLMMVFGVLGAILFALPHTLSKVCGLVFIHLWYVMDCSDGEVARISKRFSKFGTELDYTAHIVCHPLFCLAFAYSLISLGRYNSQMILVVSLAGISADLVQRNLTAFLHVYALKMGEGTWTENRSGRVKRIAIHVITTFSIYPNFALLFPIAYFIDCTCGTSIALGYLLIQTVISVLVAARGTVKWIMRVIYL